MDYDQACRKYRQEVEDLAFLQKRLKTATIPEYERVSKNIESKKSYIQLLERWFRFTGNKIPDIA